MMPFTVVGDVTCADAPVTSHPAVPIAIVPTISDVFLTERRLFEPLNLYTLPPAGVLARLCGSFELGGAGHHPGAPAQTSTLVSSRKSNQTIPHLSYSN